MTYEALQQDEYEGEEDWAVVEGQDADGLADFAPLLEIGEADKFSLLVARLEEAGIPWFVENAGLAAILYVTSPGLEEARRLVH